MGKRRNILATGVTKASPRPNITEGRMSATAGKASRTTISPSPRLRMYGEEDPASEPMPETWINCLMRASRASSANSCGSCYMDGVEGLLAALHIETHGVHDALNSRHGSGNGAIIIDVGMDNSMPSPTSGKRASVRSGCLDATRIENSHSSKCWTTWRPRKPVPPNTVTFPRAIAPFPRRCRRAVPPQAPKVGGKSMHGWLLALPTTSPTNRNTACF